MNKSLLTLASFFCRSKVPLRIMPRIKFSQPLQYGLFCSTKTPPQKQSLHTPKENSQIKHSQVTVGQQTVQSYKTKGAISILDKLRGTKQTDTGELYALMFTCGQCGTRDLRSFTKNAYHNGIVLIKCEGCKGLHLVADNLGWFENEPKNLQDFGEGKVQKVHDPVAITRFLKAAFEDQPPTGNNATQEKQKGNENIKP